MLLIYVKIDFNNFIFFVVIFVELVLLAAILCECCTNLLKTKLLCVLDIPGLQLFGFHGNLNKGIKQHDRGEFMEENITPSKGRLSYFNADLELKLGDEIFFWISIQHDKLSYRKDNQKWIVTGLF